MNFSYSTVREAQGASNEALLESKEAQMMEDNGRTIGHAADPVVSHPALPADPAVNPGAVENLQQDPRPTATNLGRLRGHKASPQDFWW